MGKIGEILLLSYVKNRLDKAVLIFVILLISENGTAGDGNNIDKMLGSEYETYSAPKNSGTPKTISIEPQQNSVISLKDVLSLTLLQNSELQSFSWEVRKIEAEQLQAGLMTNPELETELENGGMEAFSISLSQLIELGGKRALRSKAKGIEASLAEWDFETKRMEVLTNATIQFLEILGTQAHIGYLEEALAISDSISIATKRRISMGAAMAVDGIRTELAIDGLAMEKKQILEKYAAQKRVLSSYWSITNPQFKSLEGEIVLLDEIPELSQLQKQITQNPQIGRWVQELKARKINVDVARADRIPNLTVSGGYVREQDPSNNIIAAGLSIELPLFNKNQGEISAANLDLLKAEIEKNNTLLMINAELAEKYSDLKIAHDKALTLKESIIPKATGAFEELKNLYNLGKINYIDLLDMQRTLTDLKVAYHESLINFEIAKTEIEFLIGQPIIQ